MSNPHKPLPPVVENPTKARKAPKGSGDCPDHMKKVYVSVQPMSADEAAELKEFRAAKAKAAQDAKNQEVAK